MKKKHIVQALLVLIVLVSGLFAARWLISNPPRAERKLRESAAPLVYALTAEQTSYRIQVVAMGTVVPAREIALHPEVTGRIIEQSPKLVPGGLFNKGETILRIDPRDYEIAVKQQEADLERARLELKLEKGRKVIAEREWKLLEADIPSTPENMELALREPQQKNAEVALAAAESTLDLARLNLERTVIKDPFNAVVLDEFVDEGQLVTPQTRLATLIGTDSFWVQVSIPVDRLRWIVFPQAGQDRCFGVRVMQEAGPDVRIEREGCLERLLGDLDTAGRMARVMVSIDDPLGLNSKPMEGALALMLGAYVRVEIEGKELEDVFVLPRTAVHEGERVWIVDQEDRLEFRKVNIIWRTKEEIVVSNDLREGERVVTSGLASPVPGMKLRVRSEASSDESDT